MSPRRPALAAVCLLLLALAGCKATKSLGQKCNGVWECISTGCHGANATCDFTNDDNVCRCYCDMDTDCDADGGQTCQLSTNDTVSSSGSDSTVSSKVCK